MDEGSKATAARYFNGVKQSKAGERWLKNHPSWKKNMDAVTEPGTGGLSAARHSLQYTRGILSRRRAMSRNHDEDVEQSSANIPEAIRRLMKKRAALTAGDRTDAGQALTPPRASIDHQEESQDQQPVDPIMEAIIAITNGEDIDAVLSELQNSR